MTAVLRKKIFVACRQLGLDNDARRDLQVVATGKSSLTDMTTAELQAVVNALQKRGFKPFSKRRQKTAPRADLRLIHVLWKKLGDAGVLERPNRAGLNTFIRARFGGVWNSVPADVDMLRDHGQIDQVIEALKAWGHRAGIDFDWRRT